jgi:hypothetical protein
MNPGGTVYTVRPEAQMLQRRGAFGVFCLYAAAGGQVELGQWTMRAVPGRLAVRAEAAGQESLRRIQDPHRRQRTPDHSAASGPPTQAPRPFGKIFMPNGPGNSLARVPSGPSLAMSRGRGEGRE